MGVACKCYKVFEHSEESAAECLTFCNLLLFWKEKQSLLIIALFLIA